jgi:predicted acyl esterase
MAKSMAPVARLLLATIVSTCAPTLLFGRTTTGPSSDPELSAAREAMETKLESVATMERKVIVPMRDGVRLSTDIYLPKGVQKFPAFDRNLNTGGRNYDESSPLVAQNTVYHSKTYPSRIQLTISSAKRGAAQR